MYLKCYNVTFKLRTVAAAEGKSTEAAVQDFKQDIQRLPEWYSQKEKLTDRAKKRVGKRVVQVSL